jgi:hypothetical protein
MDPIANSSSTADQATDPGMTSSNRVDPVRVVVHTMLAIYLSPVILAVCLIGATSILADRSTRFVRKLGGKFAREKRSRTAQASRIYEEKNQPRLIHRRERLRSPR